MKRKNNKIKVSKFFILVFVFLFLLAIIKLGIVALSPKVDGIDLTLFANSRNTRKKVLYASRGEIFDVFGETIASNANSYTLIAYLSPSRTTDIENPQHVVDKENTAKALSEVLGMDYDYALARLNTEGAYQVEFGVKGKNLSENKKQEIDALELPGIDFVRGIKRYYKNSKMASYIVGYAKSNDEGEITGEMGIESYYNDILKGEDGYSEYQIDGAGYQMGEAYTKSPVSGENIYLTLDSHIQLILEDAVHTLEDKYNMAWFTFSVMDAKTGAIVGSASSPNFNPNTLEGLTNYVNPLVGYTYEPGSTMKIFSWLAAMENGVYDGKEQFLSGTIKVGGATIQDFNGGAGWGMIDYDTGFAYSSNVGATYLAKKLGSKKLREFYESLGFGDYTNIELPGEEKGVLRLTYESELATASFGQGITTTPIETLQALSILTNDGVMLKPYIVDKIVNENGEITYQGKRTELGKKVSSESIKKMHELMYNVVYKGLSKMWRPSNVVIAGKTGTAQIASPNGGYLTGAQDYVRSFAGFFPYEDPKYIIYASAKQIDGGAEAVASVVSKAVESIASYSNISNKPSELDMSQIITLDNYISSDVKEAVADLENLDLDVVVIGKGENVISQFPRVNTEVLKGSKVFLLTSNKEYIMPDIKGWSTNEVMSFCNLIGLAYKFNGYGLVSSFNIEPNTVINLNDKLEIQLE